MITEMSAVGSQQPQVQSEPEVQMRWTMHLSSPAASRRTTCQHETEMTEQSWDPATSTVKRHKDAPTMRLLARCGAPTPLQLSVRPCAPPSFSAPPPALPLPLTAIRCNGRGQHRDGALVARAPRQLHWRLARARAHRW